jgi:hypothetical protein
MQCGLFPVECGLDMVLGFNPHLAQRLKKNFLAVGHRGLLEGEMYHIYFLFFMIVCDIGLRKLYIYFRRKVPTKIKYWSIHP